jgi:hypothetical protein
MRKHQYRTQWSLQNITMPCCLGNQVKAKVRRESDPGQRPLQNRKYEHLFIEVSKRVPCDFTSLFLAAKICFRYT